MLVNVIMPQAGQDLEVGVVRLWLKREGDRVQRGEGLVEIETEKITVEIEAPVDGILREIVVPENTETPIYSVIGVIETADD